MTYTGNKTGMLRAVSDAVLEWERFTPIWQEARGAWALRSDDNGLWVSAEVLDGGGDSGMLRARAGEASNWELFDLYRYPDDTYAFRMKENGLYVSAELSYGVADGVDKAGMLRARSGADSDWERFRIS